MSESNVGNTTKTKLDLSNAVYEQSGALSKKEASDIVETVLEIMKSALERGDKVKLSGFGNFNVRFKNARMGRNPATKEAMKITKRHVVTFKPSPRLKDAVNEALDTPEE